jgi:glycosyltransferase involved in cell wall biosynthesis
MMSVKLSIATAVYNLDEEFLRAHIERIRTQLTDEAELLLIDDCSTNNSGDVCREYADADSHIRYINMGTNGGLSAVRNKSIEEAKGKWIFFADGDDLLSAYAVETALRFSDSEADIIIHERLKFVEEIPSEEPCTVEALTPLPEGAGRTLSISSLCLDPNIAKPLGLSNRAFYHAAWGALYKKAFLVENSLLFPVGQKKAQDSVFNTETYYYAKNIEYLPFVMYFYRGNPQGITRRYNKDLPEVYGKLLGLLSADKEKFYFGDEDVDLRFRNHRIVASTVDNMRLNFFHKDNPKPKKQRKEEFLSFIEEEPYKSAINGFDAVTYNRREWLLVVKLIQKKRFSALNSFVGNDKAFRLLCGAYKRLVK